MPVYEARPANATGAPIVLVISEIWGVHEWVKDVIRRFAKDGYYAVAPELFQREGGVGHLQNIQDILKIVFAVPRKQLLGDTAAAVDWAKKRPGARADRLGVTGWCWGGGTVYQVAATNPDIKAPFLGLYGEKDTSPTPDDAKKFVDLVKQTNRNADLVIYPGAGHAFFADYRPSYNAGAAADGWKRCTGLFTKSLKG